MASPGSIFVRVRARVFRTLGSAALSHINVGVRDLRNDTARVLDAVKAGERVTLTVHGELAGQTLADL